MTDEEIIELVGSELNVGICMNEVEKYRKGILNIAKKLKAEDKKCKEIIKRTVVENFCCSDCKELLKSGVEVFNPVNVSIPVENPTYKDYMKADIQQLINCDCIFMLKNWRTSKGATLEHKIAIALDLIIIYE